MHKFVPPILFLFCAIAMFILSHFYPIQDWLTPPYNLMGVVPFCLGWLMLISTLSRYRKTKTEIHTFKKPIKLITDGFFQYTRNPIYLGFTLILLGIALFLGNVGAFIPVACFFLTANFWYIPFEEKNLEIVFGKDYLFYKRRVRRWI